MTKRDTIREELLEKYRPLTIENWHEFVLGQLEVAVSEGLPEVYNDNVFGFLCDLFGGDMPWPGEGLSTVEKNIESDVRFDDLRTKFQEKFGICFWRWDARETG